MQIFRKIVGRTAVASEESVADDAARQAHTTNEVEGAEGGRWN
ncbi:MAG: hypothetical protein WBZ36_10185 [Candidatus Nitrosopolaris sp.]